MSRARKKPIAPALPPTREELVAALDAAIDRTLKRRVALRLAERAMRDAREALDRFDAGAAPCRCRAR